MSASAPPPADGSHLTPTTRSEREPVLDLLRGVALLGILVINVELMRGPALYTALAGRAPEAGTTADELTRFLSGWLAGGKFISSFALLFGVGAALIVTRAERRGGDPRALLARRYWLLLVLGLAHMLVLFPGDILFVYAVTGFVLLLFVPSTPRTALRWAVGIYLALALVTGAGAILTFAAPGTSPAAGGGPLEQLVVDLGDRAVAAYTDGGLADLLGAHAMEAVLLQSGQLLYLPWLLALFLLGLAVGRSGLATDPATHRHRLVIAAAVGLGVGLPLNVPLGLLGPLGIGATQAAAPLAASATFLQLAAPPILAVGYLSALALLGRWLGAWRPLAAVGRMALSAYLLQSVAGLLVFKVAGLYGRVSASEALVFVVGTWVALLVLCPLWLRAFRFGPVEWLWRSWTYRRWQPLRVHRPAAPDRPV